ncbi:uncharacterized protein C16orf96 [Myripristis murdjan]|uniref:uncharacterized protein C16orf96 n=1 Tax=Myripristis murdjan TaxID=586833 RepID=UPI0011760B32|nr:uncharacterized protein C16orf96-like [Myripristis murdjan]
MSEEVSLRDLLSLSIGTPEAGAVNFSALHTLLLAMLEQLGLRDVKISWREAPECKPHGQPGPGVHPAQPFGHIEEKLRQIERHIALVEELPTGTELLEGTTSSKIPVKDLWRLMQLRSRIQTNEDGVSRAMALIQDLLEEIKSLKELRGSLTKQLEQLERMQVSDLAERVSVVEKCCRRVNELEDTTRSLGERVQRYPEPDNLHQCAAWDVLQSYLLGDRENLPKGLLASDASDEATAAKATALNRVTRVTPGPSHTSPPSSSSPQTSAPVSPTVTGEPERRLAPQSPSAPALPSLADAPPARGEAPPSAVPQRARSDTSLRNVVLPLCHVPSGSEQLAESLEALRDIGKLKESHSNLEAQVRALEAGKADQAQLVHLKKLITDKGARDVPDDLMDQLTQHQARIDSLMSDREKNVGLMNNIQSAILQLQGDCEKMHETTERLVEDTRQKQSHIEQLYKTMQQLEEKKADKQLVEMEIGIKADKRALESKVSRMQFDSMTEQLSAMFHELLSKVTGQEQDWHKVMDKLSTEMECKLNRIELDSVKKQLEDHWKNIQRQLRAQPAPELKDAAGIRRQLVARFHCISCARPVDMQTPGPHIMTLPSTPALPAHKSNRPYTVYALEQVRQHYRSERIPVMPDYSYPAVSRSCGGSHTLTSANQRYIRLQHVTNFNPSETLGRPLSASQLTEEADLLGSDGRFYKAGLNTRAVSNSDTKLTRIPAKKGMYRSKGRAKRPPSAGSSEARNNTPLHPDSAKSQRSRSVCSDSVQDWPVSTPGSTSQSPDTSARADTSREPQPGAELHDDLGQEEGPLTNL